MKHLLLLSLLLTGCIRFTNPVPWKQPDNKVIVCNNTVCCYPTSERTNMCVDSNLNNETINYYLVVKY
jgi:hypothetical protein